MEVYNILTSTLRGFKDIADKSGPFLLSGILVGVAVEEYANNNDASQPGQTAWLTLAASQFVVALSGLATSVADVMALEDSNCKQQSVQLVKSLSQGVVLPAAFTLGCLQTAFDKRIGDHDASHYTFVAAFFAASSLSGAKYLYSVCKNGLIPDASEFHDALALTEIASGLLLSDFYNEKTIGLTLAMTGGASHLLVHSYKAGQVISSQPEDELALLDAQYGQLEEGQASTSPKPK